jgi:hypothetical protein
MTNTDNDLEKLLLKIAEERRKEYGDRIWRTVEYFTVVLSAILSISIGLFIELSKISNMSNGYDFLFMFFALGIFVCVTAWFNVRREYERQLEAIAEIGKTQWYLGLATKVVPEQQRMFKKDQHILLERYTKNTFAKDEEWVKDKMKVWKNKQAALIWFGIVFWGFALIFTVASAFIIYSVHPTVILQISAYWLPFMIFAVVGILCYVEHRQHTLIVKAD